MRGRTESLFCVMITGATSFTMAAVAGSREKNVKDTRTYRTFDWMGHHARLVTATLLVAVVALGVLGSAVADDSEPNFDPSGEIFDVAARADLALSSNSAIDGATFLTEAADGGDVLTADAFREWRAAANRVMEADLGSGHLVEQFDPETATASAGVSSIVDVVAQSLPNGLANATDLEVKTALDAALAEGSPYSEFRFTLSEEAATIVGGDGSVTWTAPAFTTRITYDQDTFATFADSEIWLRDVQADLRRGAVFTDSIGIAIDGDTTFEEAAAGSAPFIFLAVALIVVLIAIVHRSFWSATVTAAGLGATTLAYYGTSALVGLKMGSLLLAFIVPIAMIGFGVDFYIHGMGRVREMQVEHNLPGDVAYARGMSAVFAALSLAAVTSIAAFLANAASGTEAIIQFGIGAAISLAWAYLILGQVAPRVVIGLEHFVGANPKKGLSRVFYAMAMAIVAVVGGLTVALSAVMPPVGAVAFVTFVSLFVAVPALITRRRNRKGAARGAETTATIRGAAHGLRPVGTFARGIARWRIITVPVVLAIGVLSVVTALRVESGFTITDFLSSDTEFVQSIERANAHFPSSGEGSSLIFIEGDLTDPSSLDALDATIAELDAAEAQFGRNGAGELLVGLHAGDLVRMTMQSPSAVARIQAAGIDLSDGDGNSIPDTAAGVRAIFDYVTTSGAPTVDGAVAVTAADVAGILNHDGETTQATAIVIQVGSFTDAAIIEPVHATMDAAAARLETNTGLEASASGEVLTQFVSMASFTQSMLVSLPLAILLTLLIAAAMLRSWRYAIVSVIPIGFVVTGVYAFMAVAGLTVNVVTATIAAIAAGVGIDFSTHFTARFREEYNAGHDRLEAVRRAGEGTGGALVLSATTSVLGFTVMALAPTPIFATFGLLTAVMIGLALAASLLVLPSLLVIAAPKRLRPLEHATAPSGRRELIGTAR